MLTQKDINIIINTLKPYNPKRIGLFGSVARNEESQRVISIFYIILIRQYHFLV